MTLAGLEAVDLTTTCQRLVGQVGTGVAAIGPPLVLVGVHIGGPAELIGTAFVSVILGTLLVMGLCTWVFVARVVRGIRASAG